MITREEEEKAEGGRGKAEEEKVEGGGRKVEGGGRDGGGGRTGSPVTPGSSLVSDFRL